MPDMEKYIEVLSKTVKTVKEFNEDAPIKISLKCVEDILTLLKEQEAKHPVCEKCGKEIDHINTSVFNYDGSDSDYSIPITYNKENGCVSFSTSQKWTGYDLTDKEQKERIRCPYCGKFPFDDSIEIEFYEPVEVMMWTSEGR